MPEPTPKKVAFVRHDLLVSTTDGVAGHEVSQTIGDVYGIVTRPQDMKPSPDLSATLVETRQEAVAALVAMAKAAGADAVIGLRFDGGKISDVTHEVAAFATAVKLVGGAVVIEDAADDSDGADNPTGDEDAPGSTIDTDNPATDNPARDATDNAVTDTTGDPSGDDRLAQRSAEPSLGGGNSWDDNSTQSAAEAPQQGNEPSNPQQPINPYGWGNH